MLLLGLFLVTTLIAQLVRDQRILIGSSRYLRVIWNPNTTTSFVYAGRIGTDIFFLGVSGGRSDSVLCRRASTTQIITTPVGCSEFVNYLCNDYSGTNRQRLLDNWNKSVIACPADSKADCFGPVYDPGYVVSGVGPSCMLPAVTWVDPRPGSIQVSIDNCTGFESGEYPENTRAAFRNANASVYYSSGSRGFLWERNLETSDYSALLLITEIGFPYTIVWRSLIDYIPGRDLGEIWLRSDLGTCRIFNLTHVTRDYSRLRDPVIPTDINYHLQPEIPWVYRTRVCNHFVNRLTYLKETVSSYFPTNVPIGGKPILKMKKRTDDLAWIPIDIKPDPMFADYESGCDHFYPKSSKFLSELDVEYNRAEPAIYSCFSPFVDLQGSDSFTSKYDNCFRLGGTVDGESEEVCVKHQARQRCRKNWIYWDNHCYYKYSGNEDFRSSLREAEIMCGTLGGTSYITIDNIGIKWLMGWYLWYRTDTVKVRMGIVGQRCICLRVVNQTEISEACDCNTLELPLCRYHVKEYPIPFADFDVHPAIAGILRDGQEGWPYDGRELECECDAGSTDKYCTTQTCLAPIIAAASVGESLRNPQIRFFKKCYVNGKCHDFRPFICDCLPGFGPGSNLNNITDEHHDHPCACPALSVPGSDESYQIDDKIYSPNPHGICNSVKAGYCDLNNTRCQSIVLQNLDPDASEQYSRLPVYSGRSLACPLPILVRGAGLSLQRGYCNGHGTCCPSGERLDEQLLESSRVDLWGRAECQGKTGCVCDPGWAGEACTSIIPSWIVRTPLTYRGKWNIQFPYTLNVSSVVGISDYEIRETMERACIGCTRGRYLVYTGIDSERPTTEIEVYTESFPICGFNANLYMNRYFANPVYRQCNVAKYSNRYDLAKLGSTIANCQCDINYQGVKCGLGVSAIRYEIDQWIYYTCGTNTLPPRGINTAETCQCNAEFGFSGQACHCRHGCGKYGRCKPPSFPWGYCENDLREVETPIPGIQPILRYHPYVVHSAQFVVYLPGFGYWNFPRASILYLRDYTHANISLAAGFHPLHLELNHTCGNDISFANPNRVSLTVWLAESASIISHVVLEEEWYPSCSIQIVYPCVINVTEIESETGDLDVGLREGIYSQVLVSGPSSFLVGNPQNLGTDYGVFDCSDVLDLIMESALFCSGRITVTQCPHTIHRSSAGEAYGLFWNRHLRLKFTGEPESWSADHYRLLRSFLHREWTDTSWDEYAQTLLSNLLSGIGTVQVRRNITVNYSYSNDTGTVFAEGYSGNQYRRLSNLTEWKVLGIPMYTFSLGSDLVDLRSIRVREIPVDITQIAIISPTFKLCGAVYDPKSAGSEVFIKCGPGNMAEPEGESLYRALQNGELASYLNHSHQDWIVWYVSDTNATYQTWDVEIEYDSETFVSIWNRLKTEVMVNGVFPYSSEANNLTNTEIADLYRTYLSPRKCNSDALCRSFGGKDGADYSRCVYPEHAYNRLWLNGQDYPEVIALGDEGGCDCRYHVGAWEPTSHCILCRKGYGPLTTGDWVRNRDSGIQHGLVSRPEDCTIPVSSAGEFCGGHGWVNESVISENNTEIQVWTSDTDPDKYITARCLEFEGGFVLSSGSSHPDVIPYTGGLMIIRDVTIYLDGRQIEAPNCVREIGRIHRAMRSDLSDYFLEERGRFTMWLISQI